MTESALTSIEFFEDVGFFDVTWPDRRARFLVKHGHGVESWLIHVVRHAALLQHGAGNAFSGVTHGELIAALGRDRLPVSESTLRAYWSTVIARDPKRGFALQTPDGRFITGNERAAMVRSVLAIARGTRRHPPRFRLGCPNTVIRLPSSLLKSRRIGSDATDRAAGGFRSLPVAQTGSTIGQQQVLQLDQNGAERAGRPVTAAPPLSLTHLFLSADAFVRLNEGEQAEHLNALHAWGEWHLHHDDIGIAYQLFRLEAHLASLPGPDRHDRMVDALLLAFNAARNGTDDWTVKNMFETIVQVFERRAPTSNQLAIFYSEAGTEHLVFPNQQMGSAALYQSAAQAYERARHAGELDAETHDVGNQLLHLKRSAQQIGVEKPLEGQARLREAYALQRSAHADDDVLARTRLSQICLFFGHRMHDQAVDCFEMCEAELYRGTGWVIGAVPAVHAKVLALRDKNKESREMARLAYRSLKRSNLRIPASIHAGAEVYHADHIDDESARQFGSLKQGHAMLLDAPFVQRAIRLLN